MTHVLLLGVGMVSAFLTDPAEGTTGDRAAYEAAAAGAGRDADAHVKLALWCEAHGMTAERFKHLGLAVLIDPAQVKARGLLGLVPYGGQWKSPAVVSEHVQRDEETVTRLAEYNARRSKARNTADSQWQLALWCEKRGLKEEAKAHIVAVTRLDPTRELAWRRLGYRKHGNRWMTEAEIEAEKAEASAQRAADRYWRPRLVALRTSVHSAATRDEAERALAAVSDPGAVRSVWSVFGLGGPELQDRAVQILGQISSAPATRALATLAVLAPDALVRQRAAETVLRRDPRDAIDLLIGSIREPIAFDVRPVGGPGMPGALWVEGQRFNTQFVYAPPVMPRVPLEAGDVVKYDAYGLPVIDRHKITSTRSGATTTREDDEIAIPVGEMMAETQFAAMSAQRQLQWDLERIKRTNAEISMENDRIASILENMTGQKLGASREKWEAWWTDQRGYSYRRPPRPSRKPTYTQVVPLAYQPTAGPLVLGTTVTTSQAPTFPTRIHHACFGAGTAVRTLSGLRAIETIRAGDEVLSQDIASGALGYKPVVAVFHNAPSATLRVAVGGDEIVVTGIHRFWQAGRGWVMARELKPGDQVRVVGGLAVVKSVEEDVVQPVFNLEVVDNHSYFVGTTGSLVHDNSLVAPTPAPFDAVPASLAAR